ARSEITPDESRRTRSGVPISENNVLFVCNFQSHTNIGAGLIFYGPQHGISSSQIKRHEIMARYSGYTKISSMLYFCTCNGFMGQSMMANHVVREDSVTH